MIPLSPAKAGFDSSWVRDPRAYARGYRYAAPTALVEFGHWRRISPMLGYFQTSPPRVKESEFGKIGQFPARFHGNGISYS